MLVAATESPGLRIARNVSDTSKSSFIVRVSSSVVITVPGFTSAPTLTRRNPTRPSNGARITVSATRACADATRASLPFSVASICSSCDCDSACCA